MYLFNVRLYGELIDAVAYARTPGVTEARVRQDLIAKGYDPKIRVYKRWRNIGGTPAAKLPSQMVHTLAESDETSLGKTHN